MPSIKIWDAYFEMKMEGVDRELNKSKAKVKKSWVAWWKAYSTWFTSSLKTIWKSLAALGIARWLFNIWQSSVKLAWNLQQAQVAFTTMLWSAQEADKLLWDLSNFAKETPFELTWIRQNAKQLLAMGISNKRLLPTLKSLWDVSAWLSVPLERLALNYGQVISQTKLTWRELKDFTTAWVPLLEQLSEQLWKTTAEVQDMISDGNVSAEMVTEAFEAMTSEGGKFANMMDAQSKTYQWVVSNFQDSVDLMKESVWTRLLPTLTTAVTRTWEILENIQWIFANFNKPNFDWFKKELEELQGWKDAEKEQLSRLQSLWEDWEMWNLRRRALSWEISGEEFQISEQILMEEIQKIKDSIAWYDASIWVSKEVQDRTNQELMKIEVLQNQILTDFQNWKISAEQFDISMSNLNNKSEELVISSQETIDAFDAWNTIIWRAFSSLWSSLNRAWENARININSAISSIRSLFTWRAEQAVNQSFAVTASANWNFLRAGQTSLVWERWPEMFVPSVPWTVVSNNTTNNNNISVSNPWGDGFMLGMRIGDGLRRGI